jgi:hypothetical protein
MDWTVSKCTDRRTRSKFAMTGMVRLVPLLLGALGAGCGDDDKPAIGDASVSSIAGDAQVPTAADAGIALSFTPTWHEHIAPLVSEKCSSCHKQNGIAPFSVQSYEEVKGFAKSMASAVERGSMPPFLAQETAECTPVHKYANDKRLTAEQKALLRAWADAGAPAGDPAKAAPVTPPARTTLAREDVIMPLPEPIVVEKNEKGDIHTCVVVDPKLDRDVYVTGRQITSGNDKVLHHVVSYVIKPLKSDNTPVTKPQMDELLRASKGAGIGQRYDCFGGPGLEATGMQFEMLGAWAPGASPTGSPPNSGQPVAKDSLVVLDVHYHPISSGPETDSQTKLSLQLAEGIPSLIGRPILLGNFQSRLDSPFGVGDIVKQPDEAAAEFKVPPGAKDHVEEMTWQWKLPVRPLRVYYAGTHMHYVGTDMMVKLENVTPQAGEPSSQCLVHTPKWDFNWQGGYYYESPYETLPQMNDGDILRMRCVFQNNRSNNFLAKALDEQGMTDPIEVKLGEDTLDEMCLASIGIVYPNPAAAPPTP